MELGSNLLLHLSLVAPSLDLLVARSLALPCMLVRGRMSDIVSEQGAREFCELVPHAEFVDVADAAHMVAGDKNDAFSAAVCSFLDSLTGGDGSRRSA